jgi:sarcosine oxidase subunit gamma
MSDASRRSALDGVAPVVHAGVTITVMPSLARVIVRGDAAEAFGIPLPASPYRAVALAARTALWLGPDEWLVLAPEDDVSLSGTVVDISHRQTGLRLDGSDAATVLNGGCPLDLHIDAFPVGMCTRTVFAKSEIVLWRHAMNGFHVEVARSFSAYVHALLCEIAECDGA